MFDQFDISISMYFRKFHVKTKINKKCMFFVKITEININRQFLVCSICPDFRNEFQYFQKLAFSRKKIICVFPWKKECIYFEKILESENRKNSRKWGVSILYTNNNRLIMNKITLLPRIIGEQWAWVDWGNFYGNRFF